MRRVGWFIVVWSAGVFLYSAIFLRSLIGCVLSVDMILMGAVFVLRPSWPRLSTICAVLCAVLAVALGIAAAAVVLTQDIR